MRRQELAEIAVTGVLLMCNETPYQGREKRKDKRKEENRGGVKERSHVDGREDAWAN